MRFIFDLDGTICNNTYGEYHQATPFPEMVDLINKLVDEGHYIIVRTARGMGTCGGNKDQATSLWFNYTRVQLEIWGVSYHELHLGKPEADLYIDDRAFRVNSDGSSAKDLEDFIEDLVND